MTFGMGRLPTSARYDFLRWRNVYAVFDTGNAAITPRLVLDLGRRASGSIHGSQTL